VSDLNARPSHRDIQLFDRSAKNHMNFKIIPMNSYYSNEKDQNVIYGRWSPLSKFFPSTDDVAWAAKSNYRTGSHTITLKPNFTFLLS
jgi:hypothetical protein